MGTVALIFPPQWCATHPYLALPSLAAFLRASGHTVLHRDLNIETYRLFLSAPYLLERLVIVERRFQDLNHKDTLSQCEYNEHFALFDARASGKYTVRHIEDALNVLASDDFYDPASLHEAFWLINQALRIVSASYFPFRIDLDSIYFPYSPADIGDILAATGDVTHNPVREIAERLLLSWVREKSPSVVGISITGASQVIPGLTLGAWLKQTFPGIHVVVGGSVVTRWGASIASARALFGSCFDSAIFYEGESALCALVEALETGGSLQQIPNLAYIDSTDRVHLTHRATPLSSDLFPPPDFDGLDLRAYLSPEPILPVLASRGCYWNQCSFCDHSYVYGNRYSPRTVTKTVSDLEYLSKKYSVRHFAFSDEAIAPQIMQRLSQSIVERKLDVVWVTAARFENAFADMDFCRLLQMGGLRALYFGLESGSERVLSLMHKGIDLKTAARILEVTSATGIWGHIFLMFGFPSESLEEARRTIEFVLDNSTSIGSVGASTFGLCKFSRINQAPTKYGIAPYASEELEPLALFRDFCALPSESYNDSIALQESLKRLTSSVLPRLGHLEALERGHLLLYLDRYGVQQLREGSWETTTQSGVVPQPILKREIDQVATRAAMSPYVFATTVDYRVEKPTRVNAENSEERFVRTPDTRILYDFRRGRVLELSKDAFVAVEHLVEGNAIEDVWCSLARIYDTDVTSVRTAFWPLLLNLESEGFLNLQA